MDIPDRIHVQLQALPETPGVYQFFGKNNAFLYIGKAKNLKKRVLSYFQKHHISAKISVMVRQIVEIKHIIVQSESEALLLENNLIKTHLPKYNVMLKDDKTYQQICIKKEPFPRIFFTRKIIKDGSEYFGPYGGARAANVLLETIRQLYPLRTCSYDLSEKNIRSGKIKRCLEYHLKNCKAPCEALQSEEDYKLQIDRIRQVIKGDTRECLRQLREEMKTYVDRLQFEMAHIVKGKIELLENYQAKSTVVNSKIDNVEVFSIYSESDAAYVNFMEIRKGAVIRSKNMELKKKLDESDEELLELAVAEIYQDMASEANEALLPFPIALPFDIKMTIPKAGDKKKLLELSQRNALFYRQDKLKQIRITDPERHTNRIMAQMKSDLRLPEEPRHMECFDNSNTQGTNPVAACVVFKNGKPDKTSYRHYNVKTVQGPDDFKSMEEIVYRRYKRLLDENEPLPQLIVIDGGKGQLSAALSSLERLRVLDKVSVIGIAKRLEEIFFPGDPIPLYLDKTSESLKIIQQIRNEAHRFGLTFHRSKRSAQALASELQQIEGVGEQTYLKLMARFKSLKRIKESSEAALSEVVGKEKAGKILSYFEKDI